MSTVAAWLAAFDETVDAASFINPQARNVAAFLRRYAADIASVIECRRDAEHELIVADFQTGAPQAPIYPIRKSEKTGILFVGEGGRLPFVVMLRDDFPDTEHQQIVPPDHPRVICIDDRPWAEARLTWTPAELIERILSWFHRAARGELQDARQPIDPIFIGSSLSFVIARSTLDAGDVIDLIGEHDPKVGNILRVGRATEVSKITPGMQPVTIFPYRVPPQRMKRLRYAPTSLTELAGVLNERGIDLLADLRARLTCLLAAGERAAWRLNGRVAVIIEMPILSPRGEQGTGIDMRSFITALSAGDIAVALGLALKQDTRSEGSKVGYVRAIGVPSITDAALAAIIVQSAEVHLEFERDLAARLAGRSAPDTRSAVLVGAGAIGSQLADSLTREGRFVWTVIDDDLLLPHNLARHVGRNPDVSRTKAAIVADHINAIIAGRKVAKAVPANLFDPGEGGTAVEHALTEADIVIDATASLVAARNLSDHPSKGRRVSAFFNPSGEAAVLLAEPEDRAVTLRDLEAQYLALILRTPRLADHLGKLAETIAYTGACRAITNLIPQSRAAILSGLAASGIGSAADREDGTISIWTLAPTGEVSLDTAPVEPVVHYQTMDWIITIDAGLTARIVEMRNSRLPSETGGILFGLVDIPARSIHLVMATSAPPGSIEEPSGFVRGMGGVDEMMEDVRRRTAGQVRYVGEWHSHPPRVSARPSSTDGRQLDWLAALMGVDSLPALMLIVADRQLAVFFATRRAEPIPGTQVAC
jgi:hypothetical protein